MDNTNKNILFLVFGNGLSKVLQIISIPLISQYYSPDDIGIFTFFLSILTILTTISMGRYELAILLPRYEIISKTLVLFCIFLSFISLLIIHGIIFVFPEVLSKFINMGNQTSLLYILPISVFLSSVLNTFRIWVMRVDKIGLICVATLCTSVVTVILQLLIGYYKPSAVGLFASSVLGISCGLIVYVLMSPSFYFTQFKSLKNFLFVAKKYKNFPLFSSWGALLNSFSFHGLTIILATNFGSDVLGFYGLAYKIVGIPTSFIGAAISQIYFKKASFEKNNSGSSWIIYKEFFIKLVFTSLILFTIIYFVIESFIKYYFSMEWYPVIDIVHSLIPLYSIMFVSSALSVTVSIYLKNQASIIINSLLLFSAFICIYFSDNTHFDSFLYVYVLVTSALYFIFLIYYGLLSKGVFSK